MNENGNVKQSYLLHILIGAVGFLIVAFFSYYAQTNAAYQTQQDGKITNLETNYALMSNQLANLNGKIDLLLNKNNIQYNK